MKILPSLVAYALGYSAALWFARYKGAPRPSPLAPTERATRLLVVGATGGTGQQLVLQALDRGYAVTAFVRRRGLLKIESERLTICEGDILDEEAVARAMKGQDAVLCALGHKRFWFPTRILSTGSANLLAAMAAQRVARLVCLTSMGLGDSVGRLGLFHTLFVVPMILPFYFWDKARQERLIGGSDTLWTLVRPCTLTDRPGTGELRTGPRSGSYLLTRTIARADVAAFMLDQVDSAQNIGRAIEIAG